MEQNPTQIEAFAVRGDRFIAIGKENSVLALAGSDTHIIDLQGKTVLPGFIDSHSHWIGDRNLAEMGTAEEAIESAISNGWTSISELFVNEDRLTELRSLDKQNNLRLRVNAYLPLSWQFERFGDWYQNYQPGHEYSSHLRIGGVKIFMDRWINIRSTLYFDELELHGLVEEAHNLGFQVAIHSVNDTATDIVLSVYESILDGESNDNHRFRIEHLVMLRNDQIQRMKNLGIIASFQFPWFNSDSEALTISETSNEDFNLIARWRDVVNAGVQSMGSTDFPWSDGPIGSSIEAIYQVVTRIGQSGSTPLDWMLNQTITIEEALRLITIDAAYGTFQEEIKGSIKISKFADFVVLSDNPLIIPVENLKDIKVLSTTIGGVTEYCAQENEGFCASQVTSMKSSTSSSNTNNSPVTSPIRIEITLVTILTLGFVIRYKKK
jgi:predicted amidohydrolase YtcJ